MADLFTDGGVAVITGAASGIGAAAARAFAARGMRVVLCDQDEAKLAAVAAALPVASRVVVADVGRAEDVTRLHDIAYDAFGTVTVLMNNAAIGAMGSDNWTGLDTWRRVLDVNLMGVVHGVQAFAASMLAQGTDAAIINTGSKQGITNPPGSPAYAVAKAGVRTLTEQLAHGLRETPGARVSAHLLVPGWTFTGLTAGSRTAKPDGAWTPEQVVDRMMTGVAAGDFYIICPDNLVSSTVDNARILWGAQDLTENRPALSRWHPDWAERFAAHMGASGG